MLPNEVKSVRPMLCLSLAWARLFSPEHKSAKEPLEWLENIISQDPSAAEFHSSAKILRCCYYFVNNDIDKFSKLLPKLQILSMDMPQYKTFSMSALGNLSAIYHLRRRNFVLAKGEATIGLSLSESVQAAFSGAYAVALISISLMQSGDLKLALKKLKDSLHSEDLRIQGSFSSAVLSSTYGLALYESGHFVEAESHLRDMIDTISKTLPTEWLIAAFISSARASEINDTNGYDSVEFLMQAEKLAIDRQDGRLLMAVRREHIRRALMKGNMKEATVFADRVFSKLPTDPNIECYHFTEGCDDDTISRFRLRIYSGDQDDVIEDLTKEVTDAIGHGWVRRQIKLLILQSIAHKLNNNIFRANDVMSMALTLAAPQSYVASFVEEGSLCMEIIETIYHENSSNKNNKLHNFISGFIEDSSVVSIQGDSVDSPLVEKLTKKELEVLTLVVSGFSNLEIAERIFVSTNTVKFHMKNLYGKLGVNSRIKLITGARSLGIEV
jgi:LuxR family maltose regulon positive regulatory protein